MLRSIPGRGDIWSNILIIIHTPFSIPYYIYAYFRNIYLRFPNCHPSHSLSISNLIIHAHTKMGFHSNRFWTSLTLAFKPNPHLLRCQKTTPRARPIITSITLRSICIRPLHSESLRQIFQSFKSQFDSVTKRNKFRGRQLDFLWWSKIAQLHL